MQDYIKKLKCLTDETRIRILKLLEKINGLYVCEIVDSLEVPFYGISRHLKELANANIVEEKRNGRFIIYYLKNRDDEFLKCMLSLLDSINSEIFEKDEQRVLERLKQRDKIDCKVCKNKNIKAEVNIYVRGTKTAKSI